MSKTRPRWGVLASYWIEDLKISKTLKTGIRKVLGKVPEAFFRDLEVILGDHEAWSSYRDTAPTLAHVRAALDELAPAVEKLSGMLDPARGIDGRTRQTISQAWILRGMTSNVIRECETALMNLGAAVELAQARIKPPKKGRRSDTNQELASSLWTLFERHGLRPSTSEGGPFEQTLAILLHGRYADDVESNVHRLALAARQARVG